MLKLQNVNKYFYRRKSNQIHVINDTTLEFGENGLTALLGPSGCGKTTLLNVIGGLDKVDKGSIYINGKKITGKTAGSVDKIRNLNIGYIFQNYNLIDSMTVFDNVAMVLKMIGIKDKLPETEEIVKKHIAIEIILNMLIGKSSDLYKKLYDNGDLLAEPDLEYEFSKQYAHVLVGGQSKNPEGIYKEFKAELSRLKENGLNDEHFERIKRKLYGDFVTEYNSVANIARMFLADSFKGINSFDYIEKFNTVTKEYAEQILKEVFNEEKMGISIINPK